MNQPTQVSMSLRAAAAACALAVTAGGLVGVDGLAQMRTVSPYAQVVQFERVVVTGQREGAVRLKASLADAGAACKTGEEAASSRHC